MPAFGGERSNVTSFNNTNDTNKMNKFALQLSRTNSDLKAARAQSTASLVEIEQSNLSNNLYRDLVSKRNELEDLFDLGPDSTTSLRSPHRDFDATAWVRRVQDLKVEILDLEVRHKLASDTFNEWFSVTETEKLETKPSLEV